VDEEALRELLLKTFLGEAQENIQAVLQSVEQLRGGTDALGADGVADLYRRVHSMKGAAGTVGIQVVQRLCHSMETLLRGVQRGTHRVDEEFLDVLTRAMDLVAACVDAGGDQGVEAVDAMVSEAALDDLLKSHEIPGSELAGKTTGSTPSILSMVGSANAGSPKVSASHSRAPPAPLPGVEEAIDELSALSDTSALLEAISEADLAASLTGQQRAASTSTGLGSRVRDTASVTSRGRRARVEEVLRVPVSRIEALSQQAEVLRDLPIRNGHAVDTVRSIVVELDDLERMYVSNVEFLSELIEGMALEADQARMQRFLEREGQYMAALRSQVKGLVETLSDNYFQAQTGTETLLDALHDIRVMPLRDLAFPLVRMVRETARGLGKRARLTLEGADLVLDKAILDRLATPLDHILRNALDHGLEGPEERQRHGKSAEGTVRLSASLDEGHAVVQLQDDGRGIDAGRIRDRAVAIGLITAEAAAEVSDDEAIRLIFEHGFSTRDEATHLSGRGLGLDIVRDAVETMGGRIEVHTELTRGTTFRLILPLRIASARGITVAVGSDHYLLPLLAVERALFLRDAEMVQVGDHVELCLEDEYLPIADLNEIIDSTVSQVPEDERAVVVLRSFDRKAAFLLDRILGAHDYVQRHPGALAMALPYVAGATTRQDGTLAVVLDSSELVRTATGAGRGWRPSVDSGSRHVACILVVDDSVTSRTLERHILEAAGYRVVLAEDGLEALEQLEREPVDLVVSDIEMPMCDGIEFVTRMRDDPRFQDVPVILVTSLGTDDDRKRGLDAGADAYIIKSVFDQKKLLETVETYL
jgi:two-component system chemotaxis sensor kinase CheA